MNDYVADGGFERDTDYISDRITRDGTTWPVEPGRYRLVAAKACPWATRSIIVRQLLGLEDVISLGLCGPTHDERSWKFDLDPGGVDPVLGIKRLREAFLARFPDYDKGHHRPGDRGHPSGQVVTNDFPSITHDLFHEWRDFHRPDAPDLWPADLRDEMDQVMDRVYTEVNNGVYRCGFAGSQEAYDAAYARLWEAMDWLEQRLVGTALPDGRRDHRGRRPAVHHAGPVRRRLPRPLQVQPAEAHRDAGALGLRPRPVPDPGFGDNTDFDQIKCHYYVVQDDINPTGIVPAGPDPAVWLEPHGRDPLQPGARRTGAVGGRCRSSAAVPRTSTPRR